MSAINEAVGTLENYLDNSLKIRSSSGESKQDGDEQGTLGDFKAELQRSSVIRKILTLLKVMELKMMESVQQAALNVGARIIQPTLIDFLR